MKKFLASFLCSFLALVAIGCGNSSSNDFANVSGQGGPAGRTPTGAIAVNLSAADLGDMFSSAALAQTAIPIDPSIVAFHLYAFDAAGNVVASVAGQPVGNVGLNLAVQGLQILNFDVVLAGVDAQGNVVGAYAAQDVFPVANGVRQLGREVFYPLEGFVLPDGNNTPDPEENIDITVSFSGNVPQVAFTGGNAFSVTAVPEDMIDDIASGAVTPLDEEYASRVYTRVSTNGTDAVASPVLLNSAVIGGTVTNTSFEGFEEGVVYQVSVVRLNGDFGYVEAELVP